MSEEIKPEVKQLTKEELFKENPDKFVSIDDLVVALMRTEHGPAMLVSPRSRHEAIMAKAECDIAITKRILNFDAQIEAMKEKNKIQKPGSFLNGVKRMFKR